MTLQFNLSELDQVGLTGTGNGQTVYKVRHRSSGQVYTLKVISLNGVDGPVSRQICREMEILRDLDHPNIIKCHRIWKGDSEIEVLLDFMDGGSLAGKQISDESHLSNIAGQILRGIAYSHGRRIVHRDIKPSKLLIDSTQNQVKVADFGPSRILSTDERLLGNEMFGYASPEKIHTDCHFGEIYDAYSGDIWSFGLSILEIYMGRFPIAVERQGDLASLVEAICASDPPEAPPHASGELHEFIKCCLQRDPTRRWSAVQLLQHPFILLHNDQQQATSHVKYQRASVVVEEQ